MSTFWRIIGAVKMEIRRENRERRVLSASGNKETEVLGSAHDICSANTWNPGAIKSDLDETT